MASLRTLRNLGTFVAFTPFAQITSTISATLSSFSSVLVMTFILRSQTKLKGAYHRIMFFMSFWDLVSSLAIAITTLPMPSNVHEIYDFAGRAFGTFSTCEIQGFLIVIGSAFTILANGMLNLYYVCTITFKMGERRFNKVVLPICVLFSAATILPATIMLLKQKLLNPTPFYPYCIVGLYPFDCNEDNFECIRGGDESAFVTRKQFEETATITFWTAITFLLISMILVICSVFKTEMQEKTKNRNRREYLGILEEDSDDNFEHTKATMRQAAMYILAFMLTWGGSVLATSGFFYRPWVDNLKFTFQPLQGFFNAFIFISAKVSILRRAKRQLNFLQAVKSTIISPEEVPEVFVSRIDIVDEDIDSNDESDIEEDVGKHLVRRGILCRLTDEHPRAAPPSGVSDLASNGTHSRGLALSSSSIIFASNSGHSNKLNGNGEVAANGNTGKGQGKQQNGKTPRRFYQWPPTSGWSSLLSSESLQSENKSSLRNMKGTHSTSACSDKKIAANGGAVKGQRKQQNGKTPRRFYQWSPTAYWSSLLSSESLQSEDKSSLRNMKDTHSTSNSKKNGTNASTDGLVNWALTTLKQCPEAGIENERL